MKTTVFHGTYCDIRCPEIRLGRYTKDFGPGFYCTVIREQALRWAKRCDMQGRETAESNNVFFACGLVDYIARKTKNRRVDVVHALGHDRLANIVELADVYHSENIDEVSDRFIRQAGIVAGEFDNVAEARYAVPSHWDIGKVYKRLVLMIAKDEGVDVVEAAMRAYRSPVSALIDDYNGSFFYESPQAIFAAYKYGDIC